MAWFIAARWVLSCPASWLGSARSAIVEYDLMSLIRTVTTTRSVSPISAAPPELVGEPAGEQAGQRLALLLPVDDGLLQHAEPA